MTDLVTIECSKPGDAYDLFGAVRPCDIHLASRTETGGTGPILCGFDRFARDEHGRWFVGFSVGGGTTGPGLEHDVCAECARLVDGRPIHGVHAALFEQIDRHAAG